MHKFFSFTSSSVMLTHLVSMRYSVRNGSDGRSSLRNPYKQSSNVVQAHGDIFLTSAFLDFKLSSFQFYLNFGCVTVDSYIFWSITLSINFYFTSLNKIYTLFYSFCKNNIDEFSKQRKQDLN